LFFKRRYAHTFLKNPDFVKLAKSYGAVGIRVTKENEIKPAIKEALRLNKPVLIDFIIEEEENVFPMVPAGEAINKMITGMA